MSQKISQRIGEALSLCLLLIVAGCSAAASTPATSSSGGVLYSVGGGNITPTPVFPTYTVGAWVSNPSPSLHDNITIYAVVRKQPTDMTQPPTAPAGAQVNFSIIGVRNQTVGTDPSGYAAFQTTADGNPLQPQQIYVTVSIGNQQVASTYTFYTILPTQYPFPTEPPQATPTP